MQPEQTNKIRQYLATLERYLARLDPLEANEVLREIESHIYDAIELQERSGNVADVAPILQGLGAPRQLAEQYVSHILQGSEPPAGLARIQAVKRTVSKTLYWSTGLVGYGLGCVLILMAFSKLLLPQQVGVWSSANGHSFVVGIVDNPLHNSSELLGMWLVPLGVILGYFILRVTHALLSVLKRATPL